MSERGTGLRSKRGAIATGLLIACSAATIAVVQPRVAANFEQAVVTSDVYALPSPEQSILLSLGHRSALADLLYGVVRVSYGRHVGQRRRFEFVENYLDTITTLDPQFLEPYLFTDTFLTLQNGAVTEDFLAARRILRRGMSALPYNQKLWNTAGQFIAYIATSRFKDPDEIRAWRLEGGKILAHACSLTAENENIPFHCITAATILSRAGEREAVIEMLNRTLAVSDDPEIRALAMASLKTMGSEEAQERSRRRFRAFADAWHSDLAFVSQEMILLLGPNFDAAKCAGAFDGSPECATTWRDWAAEQPL